MKNPYFTSEENKLIDQFFQSGYVIFPLDELECIESVKANLYNFGIDYLKFEKTPTIGAFFDEIHKWVSPDQLNEFRVNLINQLKQNTDSLPKIYHSAKTAIHQIVGNELAMQRNSNLSIQIPQDSSSLLPIHSDIWSGNSPYEIVLWIPLVDCYRTKSMFLLPKPSSDYIIKNFNEYSSLNAEELFCKIQDKVLWLEVPYGHGVIFTHTLLHGNRINEEDKTRWSINIRFKSLLSPYGDKELGETFLPITMRPLTRIGYNYKKEII